MGNFGDIGDFGINQQSLVRFDSHPMGRDFIIPIQQTHEGSIERRVILTYMECYSCR